MAAPSFDERADLARQFASHFLKTATRNARGGEGRAAIRARAALTMLSDAQELAERCETVGVPTNPLASTLIQGARTLLEDIADGKL